MGAWRSKLQAPGPFHRGEALDPLLAALKGEEERKTSLTQELEGLTTMAKVASLDAIRLQRDLQARAADVRALLGRHVPQARQMLRKVLVGRLEVTPIEQDGQKGVRVEGRGSYGPLLAGEATATMSSVPTGTPSHAGA